MRAIWREVRPTLVLAMPIIFAQLALIGMNLVATMLIGRLGGGALAVGGLANTFFFTATVIGNGVISSVGVMAGQADALKRPDQAGLYAHQGIRLGLATGLAGMPLLWLMPELLAALGYDAALVGELRRYLPILSLGLAPYICLTGLRYFMAAVGRPRIATLIALAGVGLVWVFGEGLIFGRFGMPALGLIGGAFAMVLAMVGMLAMFLAVLLLHPAFRSYRVLWRAGWNWPELRELFQLGWPAGLTAGFETLFFTTTSALAARFTAPELAAHAIANQCIVVTFMCAVGLSQATMVRVAQAAALHDWARARRIGYAGIAMGLATMSANALLLFALARPIVGAFVDAGDPVNGPVVASAITLFAIAALFQVADGTQNIASGALRGIKDVRGPMLIGLISYWPVGQASGVLFGFVLGWRVVGLWWGMAIGLSAAAIALTLRFRTQVRRLASLTAAPATR